MLTWAKFVSSEDTRNAHRIEFVLLFNLSCLTWFEENFGTQGNHLALELFSIKFAPCADLIIVWLNVEEMTHTGDCISPEAWWNSGLQHARSRGYQQKLIVPFSQLGSSMPAWLSRTVELRRNKLHEPFLFPRTA